MNRRQAAGDDGIPVDISKAGGGCIEQQLFMIHNSAYETGFIPPDWQQGVGTNILSHFSSSVH